mmetsp:Transcript_35478/g.93630  ORF Transcript_35478/g.93630 Transcript_35478/m.93630 type:complete len:1833 (-) Transcript_35478:32-5530(-)
MGDDEENLQEELEEEYNEKSRERLVAMYDFDPSSIDWPFRRQRPLPLKVGQVIQIVHDDGGEWSLGHPVGQKELKGYFPRNYTVTVAEYNEMMRDYEMQEAPPEPEPDAFRTDTLPPGPPVTRALPAGPIPTPSKSHASRDLVEAFHEEPRDLEDPELVYPGIAEYPTLEARPPIGTVYELQRSKLLREMPTVPEPAPEQPAPPRDDVEAARLELERELEEIENADITKLKGGELSHSRASTPATHAQTRPERDYTRGGSDEAPHLQRPTLIADQVRRQARQAYDETSVYKTDLRCRATTCRLARNIEPPHMKIALKKASGNGQKWTQMFRPGFNDLVNESFKVGCNACLLSKLYVEDKESRELFQKMYALDVKGTFWHELQRRKKHLFYMRMDFVDVMMCHPDAWGFPDAGRIVSANAGEPINPFHGWYAQHSIDADRELEDVEFLYSLRLRAFPEQTFQALSLGKIPEWIAPYLTLCAEAQPELDPRDEEADAGPAQGKEITVDGNLLMEAGLEESDDLYVRLDELRLAKERTAAPDVLDVKPISYRLRGLSAMRIFLRSRGNPDNMKQTLISPKMVKDMAAQLGIRDDPARYWYCLFALRYPQSPEWEVVIRNDTRWYLHLPSDRLQPVHPMIRRFREHLDDCKSNEFLWDYRGFVKMKCSECGLPDSVIWCHQCTDYFCAPCYLHMHKSRRGKKHWPMPVPGSRYLTGAEAGRLKEFLPLLNAGFSNRRRFLARDNQSDKNGSRNGDTWLFFHADTFHAALQQAPERHWYLKRLKPPRLAPGVDGYYYNFGTDVIADDASYILTKAHEQQALSVLQKNMRGALTRRAIGRQTNAAVVIQKTKLMWDVLKTHGSNGKNAAILKSWYRKYRAREDKALLIKRLSKIQGYWRGYTTRKEYRLMLKNLTGFQAAFRGIRTRRRAATLLKAALTIQRFLRGMLYGRRFMRRKHLKAARVQAMYRGVTQRRVHRAQVAGAVAIQCHYRGLVGRKYVRHLHACMLKLQTNWRRFQAQIAMKRLIYERIEEARVRRQAVLREKLEDASASLFQRNWLRHRDYEQFAARKREKGEADKRTSTMLVAMYSGAANLRNFIHPWWRHLPREIQEVLKSIKNPLQRTIAQVPITGKLANEEIGRRGLRVQHESNLTYNQTGKDPDLASHLLISISRHLLSHVPAEDFAPTIRWACYAIAHQAVKLNKTKGYFPREEIPVGKELPPHPGDTLHALYKELNGIQTRGDRQLQTSKESLPCLFLKGLPTHHRHVFLTAEVLITMRQALDTPSLATDDHLRFQGVDASAGAQLMEILGSEMDHRLPLDWPKVHGTVAALASQAGTHMSELKPDSDGSRLKPKKRAPRKKGAASKGGGGAAQQKEKAPDSPKKGGNEAAAEEAAKAEAKADAGAEEEKELGEGEGGILSHFNRASLLRIMQQVGYFMADQNHIIEAVLKQQGGGEEPMSPSSTMGGSKDENKKGQGVRQSRYVAVTDRLFELADREKHDHTSFVLSVVLYHMVLRGLMLRVQYHRAAITLQKRYRYLKTGSVKRQAIAPAICIQRFWRGLSTRLQIMKMDDAAARIQHSYRAWNWNRRCWRLVHSTVTAQRLLKGAIARKWMKDCHRAATLIQKTFRRMLVILTLNPKGRELMRKQQKEMNDLLAKKAQIGESMYYARTAVAAAKFKLTMAKHRDVNVEIRRSMSFSIKSAYARRLDKQKKLRLKGILQPVRLSVFEPLCFAVKRLAEQEDKKPARMGAPPSKVGQCVAKARKQLERGFALKPEEGQREKDLARSHAAARSGRRAARVRRLNKAPKLGAAAQPENLVDAAAFEKWMTAHFAVRSYR